MTIAVYTSRRVIGFLSWSLRCMLCLAGHTVYPEPTMPESGSPSSLSQSRLNISSETIWEQQVGYSRAVRVGSHIFVTGTIAADRNGLLLHPDNPYEQTLGALRKIETALHEAGATLLDVVRTRMYVVNLDHWLDIARAHRELLGEIRPATTMVQVSRLFADALVEIEVDAIVASVDPA